ncbi:MAG: hypothetical protein WKF84_19535 [Pyrinomonadaceae bacterium]
MSTTLEEERRGNCSAGRRHPVTKSRFMRRGDFRSLGDLSKRKLMPALYNLACEGCTGRGFEVLGVGRTHMTDEEFRAQMREAVAQSKGHARLQ